MISPQQNIASIFTTFTKTSLLTISALVIAFASVGSGALFGDTANAAAPRWISVPCNQYYARWVHWNNYPDQRMRPGNFCLNNGVQRAIFQTDGNLVVYRGNTPVWASGTNGKVGANGFLAFQGDGNTVIYNGSSRAVWTTHTAENSNRLILRDFNMQTDDNFVIYTDNRVPIWNSKGY